MGQVYDKHMQNMDSNLQLSRILKNKLKQINPPVIWLSLIVVLAGVLRSLSINKELTEFLYCDEAIYHNEIEKIIMQDDFVTRVFLSGGVNFFPISFILEFFMRIYPGANADLRLVVIRFLFPVVLSSLTTILIYFLAKSLNLNYRTALASSMLYSIAAFPISQSHIYYPDSYSVFFGTLAMYSIIKFMNLPEFKLHFMALAISLGVSTKYTLICFLFTAILALAIKCFNLRKSLFEFLKIEFLFVALFALYFSIMNYSIFFHPFNFFYGIATNIVNYGVNDGSKLNAVFFYIATMLLLPLGISGLCLSLYGLTILKNIKTLSVNIMVLISPIVFFLLLTRNANLATVRNLNAFMGIIFIVFGFVFMHLISNRFRILGLIVMVLVLTQSLYYVSQTIREDSRHIASKWIDSNVLKGETIGVNLACGYKPPVGNGYKLISDPGMKNKYNYYLFDMYWTNTKFYTVYSRNSWFLEFNPFYSMFYHSHNQLPTKLFSFKGFNKSIESMVPLGYEYKIISGFGPDIIILRKTS